MRARVFKIMLARHLVGREYSVRREGQPYSWADALRIFPKMRRLLGAHRLVGWGVPCGVKMRALASLLDVPEPEGECAQQKEVDDAVERVVEACGNNDD